MPSKATLPELAQVAARRFGQLEVRKRVETVEIYRFV